MNLKRLCPCGDPSAEGRDMPVGESLLPNPTTTPKYTTPPPPCPAGKYSSVVNKARGCGGGSSPCPVSASSRYEDFAASLAVDGQTDNYFHTVCDSANEWFMLDLESESNIASVTIYNRVDGWWDRIQGAEIRVGNVNSFDGNPACASNLPGDTVITVTCGATGRYVFVVQQRPSCPFCNPCLHFAEIEVFTCTSCPAGKYKAVAGINTACDDCVAGKYSATAGVESVCVVCVCVFSKKKKRDTYTLYHTQFIHNTYKWRKHKSVSTNNRLVSYTHSLYIYRYIHTYIHTYI
jgi:hypothetical protein